MPMVRANDGHNEIYLTPVDQFTNAHDAAHELWQSAFEAAKMVGGAPLLRTPENGEWGFLVIWEKGPDQWADAYVVDDGADAPGFTATAEEGNKVRFVDLD